MSTNPRTKVYRRRVRRIARELSFSAWSGLRDPVDIYQIGREIDPGATQRMVEEALAWAIRDEREMAGHYARGAERHLQYADRLEAMVAQTRRARLRVIEGGP